MGLAVARRAILYACAICLGLLCALAGAQGPAPTDVQRQTKLVLPTIQPEATPEVVALPTSSHSSPIESVEFSRDGRTLVTRAGSELFVWDLAGRFVRWRLPYPAAGDLGISPDGTLLAVDNGLQLDVWNTRVSECVSVLEEFPGRSIYEDTPVFSPDGTRIAVSGVVIIAAVGAHVEADDLLASIGVFDAASGRLLEQYTADQGTLLDPQVVFRADGALLVAYDGEPSDGVAKPSRMVSSSGEREAILCGSRMPVLSADGEWLAEDYLEGAGFHVRLLGTRDGSVRHDAVTEISIPRACSGTHVVIAADPDGTNRYRAFLLDTTDGSLSDLPGAYGIDPTAALSCDGAYVATPSGVFDTETGRLLLATPVQGAKQSCRLGEGERSLISLSGDQISARRRTGADAAGEPAADVMRRRLVYEDPFTWAWAGPDDLLILQRGPTGAGRQGSCPVVARDPLRLWAEYGHENAAAIGLQDDGTVLWAEHLGRGVGLGISFRMPGGKVGGTTSQALVQAGGAGTPGGATLTSPDWSFPSFGAGARRLAFLVREDPMRREAFSTEPAPATVAVMDVASGTVSDVFTTPPFAGSVTWAHLLADDKTVAVLYTHPVSTSQELMFCDAEAGQVAGSWNLGRAQDSRVLAMSADGGRVVASNSTEALIYALPAGTPAGYIPPRPGQTISSADISFTGDRLVVTYGDGQSTFWDLSPLDAEGEPRLLGTIYDWADGEWATVTPAGFVDCSPGAGRYLAWRLGESTYPFEQFAAKYRRPVLVRQALAGEDISAAGKLTGADVPPTAVFLAPEYDAVVDAASAQVKLEVAAVRTIERVDLLIDGRPVPEDIAAAAKWEPTGENHGTYTFDLPLSQYQHRTRLQAVVHDAEGLQSMPAEVTFTRAGAPAPTPVLHAFSVGVSRYRNEEWNTLKYADKDAESFAQVAGGTSRQLLTNEDATTTNVRFALETMKAAVTEDDVAVVFLAGHGAVDGEGSYYFLLHDTDKADLRNTGLPWDDFVTALKGIRARLVMVFADTCHSGSLTGSESVNTLIDRLNRKAGVVVFTASRGDEASIEREDWGHGAFTKALLEGFAGQADTYPVDKQVSLAELRDYVLPRVDELTSGRQHPYIPRLQDFDPARPICSVVPGPA